MKRANLLLLFFAVSLSIMAQYPYQNPSLSNAERAKDLFAKNEANAKERFAHLQKLKALYE